MATEPWRTSRWRRVTAPAATIGALAAATLALHLRDPHDPGSWGVCMSWAVAGVYCPGCGGLRAVNDLSNLDVAGAFSSNPLFVLFVPVIGYLLLGWLGARWRGRPFSAGVFGTPAFGWTVLVLQVAFGVLRNVPGFEFLGPARP